MKKLSLPNHCPNIIKHFNTFTYYMHTISPGFLCMMKHMIAMQIPEANARIIAPLPTPTAIQTYICCSDGLGAVGDGRKELVGIGEEEGTGQSSMWRVLL